MVENCHYKKKPRQVGKKNVYRANQTTGTNIEAKAIMTCDDAIWYKTLFVKH